MRYNNNSYISSTPVANEKLNYRDLKPAIKVRKIIDAIENTFDDIMEVMAWSMRHLLEGTRPSCRHDGQPFNKSDHKRAKKSGNLPFQACLNQVRGDWDWMGKCFHLPFHNVK